MKKAVTICLVLVAIALAPLVARCGRWRTVHEWASPSGAFGLDRPLRLSVQEFHAFVDPLALYQEHRIVVSGGGYACVVECETNFFDEIASACVEWGARNVTFSVPSWVTITIPKERVLTQIGS